MPVLKHALIVDDSRTAAVALVKLLSRQGVSASLVNSGEAAVDYLQGDRPDLIFMDHMMPGMDGFQAVKSIRSDPETARIPIVMYTSNSGDIYVGQARALGAVDLLAKPVTEERLVEVLQGIETSLANQVGSAETVAGGGPLSARAPVRASDTMELDAYAVAMAAELHERSRHKPPGRQNGAEDAHGNRTVSAVAFEPVNQGLRVRQWFLPVLFMLSVCWLLFIYWSAEQTADRRTSEKQVLITALEWSLNRDNGYDFGEVPFSRRVLETLETLLPRLQSAGFTGVVRLEGHIGAFCLSRVRMEEGSEIEILAEPELPLNACHLIGYGAARAARQSALQTSGFSHYLASQGLASSNAAIRVEIVAMGSRQPRNAYPTDLEEVTAGDWNTIALSNNRVHFALVPDSPSGRRNR